ncbi:MAG TPA: hypothetical protein DCQ64_28220 [Candidatus Rokubacteria bacterium]|nr:hypothetical protein [Candidatus Rokubacteria bacterium]
MRPGLFAQAVIRRTVGGGEAVEETDIVAVDGAAGAVQALERPPQRATPRAPGREEGAGYVERTRRTALSARS